MRELCMRHVARARAAEQAIDQSVEMLARTIEKHRLQVQVHFLFTFFFKNSFYLSASSDATPASDKART